MTYTHTQPHKCTKNALIKRLTCLQREVERLQQAVRTAAQWEGHAGDMAAELQRLREENGVLKMQCSSLEGRATGLSNALSAAVHAAPPALLLKLSSKAAVAELECGMEGDYVDAAGVGSGGARGDVNGTLQQFIRAGWAARRCRPAGAPSSQRDLVAGRAQPATLSEEMGEVKKLVETLRQRV
jgi:hypothetical protein